MREIVRKVGQRILAGFDGLAASPDIRRMIRDYGVGQLILFSRNVDGPEQVADLVRELQSIARDAGHDLPLLVSVDQEGGRVQRLRAPWTVWPPMRALGRMNSEAHARRVGEALAEELLSCGIRLDFAPVADVDTNPQNPIIGDRALSDDPERAGRLAAAFIAGMQGKRVAACAKHFPGHGDTDKDSHLDLPYVDHGWSRLQDVELRPFRATIDAKVATIMVAHVLVRELDDVWPATLSPRIVKGLLRDEMKYSGVIITDDLEMKAVADRWPWGPLAVQSARAGNDVLPFCASHDAQVMGLEAVIRAIEGEELSWKDNDESCERIRLLKEQYLLPWRDPDPREARRTAGRGETVALAQELADAAGYVV